jgi:uncharacterized membrane protein
VKVDAVREQRSLEWAIEAVLSAGVVLSGTLLLAGLLRGDGGLLRAGVVLLIATPVTRVVVLTAGLIYRRDWLFALVSAAVLTILGGSAAVALWVEGPRAAARPAAGAPR